MSKSAADQGTIGLFEDPASITRKVMRAVTDTDGEVRYDPATKPGVSNLLALLAVATDRTPQEVAADYTQYGPLKTDTAAALVEMIRPVQERYAVISADPAAVVATLAKGAAKAADLATPVLARARSAVGLISPE